LRTNILKKQNKRTKRLTEKQRTANSGFAKAGVLCFKESEVLNSNFVLLMKFSDRKPRLRKAAKRWAQLK
jgi:hypothetical protein